VNTSTPPFPDDLRLPSLDALRAFEATVRLGSFERAAEELHVTASAIGKRLGSLEDLLGVALLDRSAKPLQTTAAGREYLAQLRAPLAALAALPQHRRVAQARQRITLCAPPTFARLIIVPALPRYSEAHPEVELELVLSVPFFEQVAPPADLEVRHGPVAADPQAVLMHDHLVPLASPGLLADFGPLDHPADLARLPLLRAPMEPWQAWFRGAGLALPEPDQGPRLIDLGLMMEAAIEGQGVVLARPSLARRALQTGALVPVLGPARTPVVNAPTAYQLLRHAEDSRSLALDTWLRDVSTRAAAEGLALLSGTA